jgi:hypothetical protein
MLSLCGSFHISPRRATQPGTNYVKQDIIEKCFYELKYRPFVLGEEWDIQIHTWTKAHTTEQIHNELVRSSLPCTRHSRRSRAVSLP